MKTIGLLGGMSWESTTEYYRWINTGVRERLGGLHSADLLLRSVDFDEIARLQAEGEWDRAGVLLGSHARALQTGGAELIVVCTNTMHAVIAHIEAAVDIPVLHIGDVTASAVRAAGSRRVGLLGTAFTMEQPFLRERLAAGGIETLVPDAADRAVVHGVIFDELVRGIVREPSRDEFRRIIAQLHAAGADGIVLGCTEIELLVDPADSPVPIFPTARLHAEAAVAAALE